MTDAKQQPVSIEDSATWMIKNIIEAWDAYWQGGKEDSVGRAFVATLDLARTYLTQPSYDGAREAFEAVNGEKGEILQSWEWNIAYQGFRHGWAEASARYEARADGGDRATALTQAQSQFAEWLTKQMPAGTVIGDPAWWAPRIYRAATRATKEPLRSEALRIAGADGPLGDPDILAGQ